MAGEEINAAMTGQPTRSLLGEITPRPKQIFRPIEADSIIGGLTVRKEIPNTSSIQSSLENYENLGLQEVPMSAFQAKGKPKYYSKQEEERTKQLAKEIQQNKEINPLIVVKDDEGYYILEGGHRFDALKELDIKSFPALVVQDTDLLPISKAQTFNYPQQAAVDLAQQKPSCVLGGHIELRPPVVVWVRFTELVDRASNQAETDGRRSNRWFVDSGSPTRAWQGGGPRQHDGVRILLPQRPNLGQGRFQN
jgi:hypothetical protein